MGVVAVGFLCKHQTMIVEERYNMAKWVRGKRKLCTSNSPSVDCARYGLLKLLSEENLAHVPVLQWISSCTTFILWCKVEVTETTAHSSAIQRHCSCTEVSQCVGHMPFFPRQITNYYGIIRASSLFGVGFYLYLLALVESSLEVLLMLALLSRFFLQSVSLCLVWLEEGGDEEELVLARESSSDIPVWIGEEPGPEAENDKQQINVLHTTAAGGGAVSEWFLGKVDANLSSAWPQKLIGFITQKPLSLFISSHLHYFASRYFANVAGGLATFLNWVIKCALCSFEEDILVRRERTSLTDFCLCIKILFLWLNKQTNKHNFLRFCIVYIWRTLPPF